MDSKLNLYHKNVVFLYFSFDDKKSYDERREGKRQNVK